MLMAQIADKTKTVMKLEGLAAAAKKVNERQDVVEEMKVGHDTITLDDIITL